jgi:hypothetical protein
VASEDPVAASPEAPPLFVTGPGKGGDKDQEGAQHQSLKENRREQVPFFQEELPLSPHDPVGLPDVAEPEKVVEEGCIITHRSDVEKISVHEHLSLPGGKDGGACPVISVGGKLDEDVALLRCETRQGGEIEPAFPGEAPNPLNLRPAQREAFHQDSHASPTPHHGNVATSIPHPHFFQGGCRGCQYSQLDAGWRKQKEVDAEGAAGTEM